ncbi:MAG: hypothetical protein ACR2OB_13650 [Solirubrobacteraceae bacterium]
MTRRHRGPNRRDPRLHQLDAPVRARHRRLAFGTPLLALLLAGCGASSGGAVSVPKIAPARTYALTGFTPAAPIVAGRPTTLSFTIRQPSGQPLAAYKQCCEPHAGVDLIIARSDDSHVQYDDSDIAASGKVSQSVVFPVPGRYRIVVDAYPKQAGPQSPFNFQLFTWVTVRGAYHPQTVPAFNATQTVDGYRFQVQGHPQLKAIEANFLTLHVLDPHGHKVAFTSWRGALAHAIFIHEGSLDYFHTHVCSPGATYCTSALGATKVTGSSSAPGELKVGVLLPETGTWRMFLLTNMHGHVLTAPYTLKVT